MTNSQDERSKEQHIRNIGILISKLFKCFPVYPNETDLGGVMRVYVEVLAPYRLECIAKAVSDYSDGRAEDHNPKQRPSTAQLAIAARAMDDKISMCERMPPEQMRDYVKRFYAGGGWPEYILGPAPGHPGCHVPANMILIASTSDSRAH